MPGSKRIILQFLLTLSSLLCIAFGILRGEAAIVLGKAIKVCLECIGIG